MTLVSKCIYFAVTLYFHERVIDNIATDIFIIEDVQELEKHFK